MVTERGDEHSAFGVINATHAIGGPETPGFVVWHFFASQ